MKTFVEANKQNLPVQLTFFVDSRDIVKLRIPEKDPTLHVRCFNTRKYYPNEFYKIKYIPLYFGAVVLDQRS